MVRVILVGSSGRMGRAIADAAKAGDAVKIVAGVDLYKVDCDFPVFDTPDQCDIEADCVIDFSNPSVTLNVVDMCRRLGIPLVMATTGLDQDRLDALEDLSKTVAVFTSANMSLGVNLLIRLSKMAAAMLEGSFDIEIVERHHNQKLDAPSGTALALADAINETLQTKDTYVYDRQSRRERRDPHEIGISSIRGGNIVGEHEVLFAGRDEIVSLTHRATSREVFAVGALRAAEFMAGKTAGRYNMNDLIDSICQV
ncbi:MAG: 4-hydroxy-tetrahydrodipicolinate reductase [Clostridia bacterium]|nr:4-hydroxy-tetrahydrodipicolinate reductase [Clostridia bacterium]